MKAWKPEIPKCHIAEAVVDVAERRNDALASQVSTRDTLHETRLEATRIQKKAKEASAAYSASNKLVEEVREEARVLRTKAHERRTVLQQNISTCEGIIEDILHYTELYSLPAGKAARMNKVLRETLRRKRVAQDELALLTGAHHDLVGTKSDEEQYSGGSYNYHKNRLESPRSYRPREVTLAQVLSLQAVEPEVPKVNPKLARFAHIRSNTK